MGRLLQACLLALLVSPISAVADEDVQVRRSFFNGSWVINEELSDDTDERVEQAIKDAGGKVRSKRKGKARHRGGPANQKMYDHLSYDEGLEIHYEEPEFRMHYDQGFDRVFYSDGRSRTVSAYSRAPRNDYSFADWEGEVLYVESTPLDAGHILETYQLSTDGQQLQLELELRPATFIAPITIKRVYDRIGNGGD
jgi:hypothetical protein